MTDTTTFGSPVGDSTHLRIHSPTASQTCPYRTSLFSQFPNVAELNRSFQLATGWQLDFVETAESYVERVNLGNPDFPGIGELSIVDLSPLLPPGIPAVSRIYCERLVDQINSVLQQLAAVKRENYLACRSAHDLAHPSAQLENADSANDSPSFTIADAGRHEVGFSGAPLNPVQQNAPLRCSGFAFTCLELKPSIAICDWHIDDAGVARFVTAICENGSATSTRELLTVRSTFHAECRHGAADPQTYMAIKQTLDRFFDGDNQLLLAVGSMNPLLGDLQITGDPEFQALSTSPGQTPVQLSVENETRLHLPVRNHFVIHHAAKPTDDDLLNEWFLAAIGRVRQTDVSDLKSTFQNYIQEAVPSLPSRPDLALAISRF